MSCIYRVRRFEFLPETNEYIVGIDKQFMGTQHFIETTVPHSENQLDVLRNAWSILDPQFDEWSSSISTSMSDESRRQFFIDDIGDHYTVSINDQFRGQTKCVTCTIQKPIENYVDIFIQSWTLLGPQLEAWRQEIINGKIVMGTYFHLENDQPVLD